jgi:hypothetical protein
MHLIGMRGKLDVPKKIMEMVGSNALARSKVVFRCGASPFTRYLSMFLGVVP